MHQSSSSTRYAPTSPFTRLPSPPRIAVPSPILHQQGSKVEEIPYVDRPSETLRIPASASADWKYSARHTAQQIVPTLMLGPTRLAKDPEFLKQHGVTITVGLRPAGEPYSYAIHGAASEVAEKLGIDAVSIEATTNQDLIAEFEAVNFVIKNHLETRTRREPERNVLLHCETGNERSACAAAAYLMYTLQNTDHLRAMQLVQSQRFSANFDEDRKRLLQGYWDVVQAERDVRKNQSLNPTGLKKRGRSAAEADSTSGAEALTEGGIQDADDVERFDGRAAAPYVDQSLGRQHG
ncbi:hypothetical protein ANO11243_023880 [Dothideomycetidae sp. 11243]|nr:hypothetical protein ANO11243_023880 [fungal sp. No.11243]